MRTLVLVVLPHFLRLKRLLGEEEVAGGWKGAGGERVVDSTELKVESTKWAVRSIS